MAFSTSAVHTTQPAPSLLGAHPNSTPAASSSQSPLLWKDLPSNQKSNSNNFNVSYEAFTSEDISFSDEDISEGQKAWEQSLIGYAIGKRPFYLSLHSAVQKRWKLKGSFELPTLEGDFFLFSFSCKEDYDLVWDSGPCFLNGRPFFFKKWNWDFVPVKEELSTIPLWIKLPNLPTFCWTEKGLSQIASRIGIPIAVDNLTVSQTRITFARICVLITPSSPLPSTLNLEIKRKKFLQPVVYDWKPSCCSSCSSFSHINATCPLLPTNPATRGRSRSRKSWKAKSSKPFRNISAHRQSLSPTSTVMPPTANANLNPTIATSIAASPGDDHPSDNSNQNPSILLNDLNHPPVASPPTVIQDDPIPHVNLLTTDAALTGIAGLHTEPPPSYQFF